MDPKGNHILLKTSHFIDVFLLAIRTIFVFFVKNGTEMAPIGTDGTEKRLGTRKVRFGQGWSHL